MYCELDIQIILAFYKDMKSSNTVNIAETVIFRPRSGPVVARVRDSKLFVALVCSSTEDSIPIVLKRSGYINAVFLIASLCINQKSNRISDFSIFTSQNWIAHY